MSLFTRRKSALTFLGRPCRARHRPKTASAPAFTSSSSATNTTSASASSKSGSSPYWDWDRLWKLYDEQSGTAELSLLKRNVWAASQKFDEATSNVTLKRRQLDHLLTKTQDVHGRHAALLRTRDQWTSADASQFADIVAEEVEIKRQLSQAQQDLATADADVSKRQLEYMDAMRQRYHEEQMWQDKWRVMGTYGTWALIALNSVVFLASHFFFQIREARRLKAIENLINEKMIPTVSHERDAVESRDDRSSSSIEEDNGGPAFAKAATVEESIDTAGRVESTVGLSRSDQSREMRTEETHEAPKLASRGASLAKAETAEESIDTAGSVESTTVGLSNLDQSKKMLTEETHEAPKRASEASDETAMRQSQEKQSEAAADGTADGLLMTTWRHSKTAVQRAMSRARDAFIAVKGSDDKESKTMLDKVIKDPDDKESKTVVDKVIVRGQAALDALHLPSALFGAALTGTAFLIAILFSKKR